MSPLDWPRTWTNPHRTPHTTHIALGVTALGHTQLLCGKRIDTTTPTQPSADNPPTCVRCITATSRPVHARNLNLTITYTPESTPT